MITMTTGKPGAGMTQMNIKLIGPSGVVITAPADGWHEEPDDEISTDEETPADGCHLCKNQWNLPTFRRRLPPRPWKVAVYKLFGAVAPDRFKKCTCRPGD